MIKLRDYLDSRKLTVDQFNKAPDFAFGVFVRDSDSKLVRVKDLILFMDADVEEVRDTLKFGDDGVELARLTIVVYPNNSSLTKLTCAIDKLNKIKFDLSSHTCRLTDTEILELVNNSIGLLENIAL